MFGRWSVHLTSVDATPRGTIKVALLAVAEARIGILLYTSVTPWKEKLRKCMHGKADVFLITAILEIFIRKEIS